MSLKLDAENVLEGRNDFTNFTACLIRLILKADMSNLVKLRRVFPNTVETVLIWRANGTILDLPYD